MHGVILDCPLEGTFHFPVVTGIHPGLPADERERRMQMFSGFLQQIDAARSGASESVSEVDLTDAKNLEATFSKLPGGGVPGWTASDGPLLVYFGDRDFQNKFVMLLGKMGEIRAQVGRIELVDLRFDGEVVVNPDSTGSRATAVMQRPDPKTKNSPPLVAQQIPKRAVKRAK
jgi:cell division protein FtsQ